MNNKTAEQLFELIPIEKHIGEIDTSSDPYILFDNGEIKRYSDNHPFALATHYLRKVEAYASQPAAKTAEPLTKEEIKAITDKAKQPCLIGMRAFDKDVQQYTCKQFNSKHCQCYNAYKEALDKATNNQKGG